MKLSKLSTSLLIALTTTSSFAEEPENSVLNTIYVSENSIVSEELQTPYSAQRFTRDDIQQSGATSLSDFLNQNTAVSIQPSYGNPLAPLLDMGGYGTASGHEHTQIIVDGVSLNNIDLAPPQLSSIALSSIEKLTIIRGSGSVLYGNGTSAGAIVINTNQRFNSPDRANISTSYGSNATTRQTLSAKKTVDLDSVSLLAAINAEGMHSNGAKEIDSDGTRNTVDNTNMSGTIGLLKGATSATLTLEKNNSEVYYPGSMSLSDFRDDPSADQTGGNTHQTYEITNKKFVLASDFLDNTQIRYTLNQQDKNSTYVTYDSRYDYLETEHKVDLKTRIQKALFQYGYVQNEAYRDTASSWSQNRISQDSSALYGHLTFHASNDLTLSAGYRAQTFDYKYKEETKTLKQSDHLNAYNLGLNYLVSPFSSVYANFNQAFLAPNIDRFFKNGEFNTFIEPQKSQTYTIGYKRKHNGLKATAELFYTDLEDEIYYDKNSGNNTNIDNSHKTGLNLKLHKTFKPFATGMDYAFVDAVIDRENGIDSKNQTLPGVSAHTIKLFGQYGFTSSVFASLPKHRIRATHKQGSDIYAMSDFSNEKGHYPGYKSTNISYQVSNKSLTIQAGINNLFNENNGLYLVDSWSGDIKVYPTTYERYYYVSADYRF